MHHKRWINTPPSGIPPFSCEVARKGQPSRCLSSSEKAKSLTTAQLLCYCVSAKFSRNAFTTNYSKSLSPTSPIFSSDFEEADHPYSSFWYLSKLAESKESSKATHAIYLDLKSLRKSGSFHSSSKISSSRSHWSIAQNNQNYLHDRRQFVQINDTKSSERKVTSGVPQGSRLGPLFFLVYMNNFPKAINDLFVSVFLMADDCKLLASVASLQRSLANLENWSVASKMAFHSSKTKTVIFSGLQPEYKLCNESIGKVNSHRDFGLIVSSNLSWSEHISRRLGKAYGSLNLLKRNVSTKLS